MSSWWGNRPYFTQADMAVIRDLPELCPAVLPILIAGEVPADRLGDIALNTIMAANDYVGEALFAPTVNHTIRMTRFARAAWEYVPKEVFAAEAERLGVTRWAIANVIDFYSGVLGLNNMFGSYITGSHLPMRDQLYLNACTVFNKPGMYEIAPYSFFCSFSFKNIDLHPLSDEQLVAVHAAHKSEYGRLTNAELTFLNYLTNN